MPDNRYSWSAYERLVMSKLESLEKGQADLYTAVVENKIEITRLKVIAGMIGAISGGAVTAVVTFLVHMLPVASPPK